MELIKYKEIAKEYTGKTSEITRQLCFAGIAIIWLFKNVDDKQVLINSPQPILNFWLILPLISLSIALFLDLFQYFIGGEIWIRFYRMKEKASNNSTNNLDIKDDKNRNLPIYICYYSKIFLMVVAYFFIIGFLVSKL